MDATACFAWGAALRALGATWRVESEALQHLTERRRAGAPTVVVLWHGSLVPLLWRHRDDGTTVLISRSRDGERLARVARRLGYGVARGSSSRGAVAGLLNACRVLERGGEIALAPDGPRGPARVVKPGIIRAAQRAGASLVAVGLGAFPRWEAGSWDRLIVPRPFARLRIVYAPPLDVARDADPAAAARQLQDRLDAVTRRAACN